MEPLSDKKLNISKYRLSRKRKNIDEGTSIDDRNVVISLKDEKTQATSKDKTSTDKHVNVQCACPNMIVGNIKRLSRLDFCKTTIDLAKYLLGKYLVRVFKDVTLRGRIIETEAYPGVTDPASHTYGEKRTERTKPMYMDEGTSYVYSIYGMYCCSNISSSDKGGAVLLRALEPVTGKMLTFIIFLQIISTCFYSDLVFIFNHEYS